MYTAETTPPAAACRFTLNGEQQLALCRIMHSVYRLLKHKRKAAPKHCPTTGQPLLYRSYACVVGLSGTGKSHLLRSLLAVATEAGVTCMATAGSSKAAHELRVGDSGCADTAHMAFGLNSSRASDRIKQADIIVVDDAMMLTAREVDGIFDRLYREMFSGMLLLAVDPTQVLRVMPCTSAATKISSAIHSATNWPSFRRKYTLTQQMRVRDAELAAAVRDIARGAACQLHASSSDEGFTQTVALPPALFKSVGDVFSAREWLRRGGPCDGVSAPSASSHGGMIFSTTNNQVDEHNAAMLHAHPGKESVYPMCNERPVREAASRVVVPASCTSRQRGNCAAVLMLKVGVPVRVTCNVRPEDGLFTDALATVVKMADDTVKIRLADPVKGRRREFVLGRACFDGMYQLPLALAWAVTAHKAAAFTPERAVADLRNPCWAHGQLATMLSRVPHRDDMRVLGAHGATTNAVLHEVIAGVELG